MMMVMMMMMMNKAAIYHRNWPVYHQALLCSIKLRSVLCDNDRSIHVHT